MNIYILSNREIVKNEVAGNNGENNAEIMQFHFPEQIVGIDMSKITKWIQFHNESLDLLQMIENDKYSLTDLITQYESVEYQVLLKYNNLVLWKSNIDELDFGESLDIDVTITVDDLSVLNQLKLQVEELKKQYEEAIKKGNTDIAKLIKQVEDLETKINTAEEARKTAEQNRVIAENARVQAESERNQKLANLVKEVENTILKLSHSINEYNQNAEKQLKKLNDTADTGVSAVLSAKNSSIKDIQDEQENVIEAIGNEVNQSITEFDNHVTTKTTEFNTNATNKTTAFNSNATSKTTEFNSNVTSKIEEFNTNSTTKLNSFNENYEAKVEEINSELNIQRITDLKEENKYQNQVIQGLNKDKELATEEGSDITMTDCAEAPVDSVPHGSGIYQETREGYNLVDEKKLVAFMNVDNIASDIITSTILNSAGTINIQVSYPAITEGEGNYYISCDIRLKSGICERINSIMVIYSGTADVSSEILSTPNISNVFQTYKRKMIFSNLNNFKLSRIVIQPTNCENAVFEIKKIQISKINAPYEKFGTSPSRDYPSPIEYVEGNQDVEHFNKNIFNESDFIDKLSKCCKVETEFVDDIECYKISRITEYRIDYPINFNKITTMQVIAKAEGNVELFIRDINEKKRSFPLNKTLSKKNLTIEGIKSIGVGLYEFNAYIYIAKNSIQLEEGTEETDYVPHQSEIYQLSNLPPMYSPEDKIVYLEDGTEGKGWYVYNEYKNYIVTGNENWLLDSVNRVAAYSLAGIKPKDISGELEYCNYSKKSSIQALIPNSFWVGNENIRIYNDWNFTTNEEAKSKFKELYNSNKPLIFLYPLAKPTYTKITDTVLIEQLNNLRKMFSYEGTNYITVTSNSGLPLTLKIEYTKSSKIIISRLEDRIGKLEEVVFPSEATTVQEIEETPVEEATENPEDEWEL